MNVRRSVPYRTDFLKFPKRLLIQYILTRKPNRICQLFLQFSHYFCNMYVSTTLKPDSFLKRFVLSYGIFMDQPKLTNNGAKLKFGVQSGTPFTVRLSKLPEFVYYCIIILLYRRKIVVVAFENGNVSFFTTSFKTGYFRRIASFINSICYENFLPNFHQKKTFRHFVVDVT